MIFNVGQIWGSFKFIQILILYILAPVTFSLFFTDNSWKPLSLLICLSVCLFAGSDIASATEVQSCGEDLAWCGAGEQHGTWRVEQSGRGAASPRQRRRRHRMLPYCPGAGGQLPHLTFHHHSPHPLRHSARSPPTKTSVRENRAWTTALNHTQTPNLKLLFYPGMPFPPL